MISNEIVSTDAFLDMPATSQVLYFHLLTRADDDGFVSPKVVMRMIGANVDDLNVLIGKRFVLSFPSGVVVVKHWLIHNLIRADMYKETTYRKEKETLGLNEFGAYTELRDGVAEIKPIEAPKWLKKRRGEVCTDNGTQTAHRLGKDRLGKDSIKDNKNSFGSEFNKVRLTDDEYTKLVEKIGEQPANNLIDELDGYLAQTGKRYKSHYATLLNWARRRISDHMKQAKSQKPKMV